MTIADCRLTPRAAEVLAALLDCTSMEVYGYELITRTELKASTVYRTLKRMEAIGVVVARWVEGTPGKPGRRTYRLHPDRLSDVAGLVDRYRVPSDLGPWCCVGCRHRRMSGPGGFPGCAVDTDRDPSMLDSDCSDRSPIADGQNGVTQSGICVL